ncbi:MAG: hypothetical protein QM666_09740 [Acinetobacter sp.]
MKKQLCLAMLTLSSMSVFALEPVYSSGIKESESEMQKRLIYDFGEDETWTVNKKTFVKNFSAQYVDLFKNNAKVNEQQFVAFDVDKLRQDELKHRDMAFKQAVVRFGILDSNKDKAINLKEFQDIGLKTFANFDRNQDGVITLADDQEKKATATDMPHDGRRLRSRLSMPMPNNVPEFIREYGDGQDGVTLGQYLLKREVQYHKTDANHDGHLDEPEYVGEFKQRYIAHQQQVFADAEQFAQQRFQAIAGKSATIQQKDVNKFAEKLFKVWDHNRDGKLSVGE